MLDPIYRSKLTSAAPPKKEALAPRATARRPVGVTDTGKKATAPTSGRQRSPKPATAEPPPSKVRVFGGSLEDLRGIIRDLFPGLPSPTTHQGLDSAAARAASLPDICKDQEPKRAPIAVAYDSLRHTQQASQNLLDDLHQALAQLSERLAPVLACPKDVKEAGAPETAMGGTVGMPAGSSSLTYMLKEAEQQQHYLNERMLMLVTHLLPDLNRRLELPLEEPADDVKSDCRH